MGFRKSQVEKINSALSDWTRTGGKGAEARRLEAVYQRALQNASGEEVQEAKRTRKSR